MVWQDIHRPENDDLLLQHACASRDYKERIRVKQHLKKNEELMQIRQSFEGQDYFSFA